MQCPLQNLQANFGVRRADDTLVPTPSEQGPQAYTINPAKIGEFCNRARPADCTFKGDFDGDGDLDQLAWIGQASTTLRFDMLVAWTGGDTHRVGLGRSGHINPARGGRGYGRSMAQIAMDFSPMASVSTVRLEPDVRTSRDALMIGNPDDPIDPGLI